ncbi:MAG: DUF2267 domain-containing protein [Halofilum sp. (in: g-proteobacteria)]
MATQVTAIDRTVQETEAWLKEIAHAMGTEDRQVAYHALRGTLFTVRDRLEPGETVDLSAQLPLLVRGIFYEGYHYGGKPENYRSRDEFLSRVGKDFEKLDYDDPETAARAVFTVLGRHISDGEIRKVQHMLPDDVRELWPEESVH